MDWKRDCMFNGYGQMAWLEKESKKQTFYYVCLERSFPAHKAFISVEPIEDCWLVATRGEASEWLIDAFDLVEANKEEYK